MLTTKSKTVFASLATLALAALLSPVGSISASAQVQPLKMQPKALGLTPLKYDTAVIRGVLPNGLTYIIRHNELPNGTAEFYIAQKVGATLEEDDQDGLAHFLEHMAFNGTKNFPGKGIINFLERVGVRFGENINAYTSMDQTVYNLSAVPTTDPNIVDSALLVLHDWSNFISLESEEIDKERGVIREEWRTRASASRRLYFGHMANTMPGTRYATRDVIGDTAVINNFAYDALRAYYRKWYRPDLQGIVIVGDVDPHAIEARIKEMWQDIPTPVNPAKRVYFPVELNNKPVISILSDKEATTTNIQLQYRYLPQPPVVRNTEEYTFRVLTIMLAQQVFNMRMHELIMAGAPLRYGALYDMRLTPTLRAMLFVWAPQDGKTNEATQVILDEVEKLRRWGITSTELQIAADDIVKSYDDAYANRNKVQNSQYVETYYNEFLTDGIITSAEYDRDLVHRLIPLISTDVVNNLVREMLSVEPVLQVSAIEGDSGVLSADAYTQLLNSQSSKELTPYEDKVLDTNLVDNEPRAAKVKKWEDDKVYGGRIATLSNGIKVYLKPTTLADNEILLGGWSKGGYSLFDTQNVVSASVADEVCSQMGLGKFSTPDLSKALSGKTADAWVSLNTYGESVSGASSKVDIETMLKLVYLHFQAPRVDSMAYATYRAQLETILANADKNPENVFRRKLHKLKADGNPYVVGIASLEDIKPLSMDYALKAYRERFSSARGFTFAIVGSFDTDSIMPLVCKWLGGLPTGKRVAQYTDRATYLPQHSDSVTFAVRMTTPKVTNSVTYSHKFAYDKREQLVLSALGRILDMRYLESVREDEGGSYGVGVSGYITREPCSEYILRISFDTDPKVFDHLYPILEKEIAKIADNGPLADDLDKVKKHFIKAHRDDLQDNGTWLSYYGSLVMYNTDSNDFEQRVESISAADVQRWAKKILSEANKLVVTMVPDETPAGE